MEGECFMIFAYFKYDGGFGYDAIRSTSLKDTLRFDTRLLSGDYHIHSIDELVSKLKVRKESCDNRQTPCGFVNMVTNDTNEACSNPRRLDLDEDRELTSKLYSV